ncbi:MAG: orotidine 5'-phosphate decarboxylase / HUMPS family protein [Bdellovibrionota bacterium]
MLQTNTIQFCLGIDPNPNEYSFEKFNACVKNHMDAIDVLKSSLKQKFIKLNLAFFLSYGSRGIELLEQFTDRYRNEFTIILDGKFSEIANSLQAYLSFVFNTLGAHGVTINPFLGENTLRLAFETCVKKVGEKGRVYVLCVTSEGSTSALAYLQENWRNKLIACAQIRDEVFTSQDNLKKCAGVVIGANKEDILFSEEVKESGLSVLAPGLGVQGGEFRILEKCLNFENEFTFPLSRSIFDGGNIPQNKVQENFLNIKSYFEGNNVKN